MGVHGQWTYVHIDVSIVDIETVGGLLEVDMGNAVGADVVVVRDSELQHLQLAIPY